MKKIYHGTIQKVLKPQKRYTPGGESLADAIPAQIYATYEPAYAVSHSFPWSSDAGVDIEVVEGVVTLVLSESKKDILEQEVCVYTLPDETFSLTEEEEMGLTYHSTEEVVPLACQCFQSVTEAMEKTGGVIKLQ